MQQTTCGNCGRALSEDEPNVSCPDCGSTLRKVSFAFNDSVNLSARVTGVGLRDNEAFAFTESEGAEFTRYAHLESDGTLVLDLRGLAPRNEDDSDVVCELLAAALRFKGDAAKVTGRGKADEDCILSLNGQNIGIQVVRALSDPTFWRELAKTGSVGPLRLTVAISVAALKAAIEHKRTIPRQQRTGLILLLDAYRVPAVSLAVVAKEFVRSYGQWADTLGFRAIFVVGPSKEFLHCLAGAA